jgi:transposase
MPNFFVEVIIAIYYEKYEADRNWDELKGYVTKINLPRKEVIGLYSQLWQVEKAFLISNTGLRIRPVNHRLINRVETHLNMCFVFAAYAIYKELERLMKEYQIGNLWKKQ